MWTYEDLSERSKTTLWAVGAVCTVIWLVVFGLLGFGLALGDAGPEGRAPSVDFSESTEAVVLDATRKLNYRDYTVERWWRTRDYRNGTVLGGLAERTHVENSKGAVRRTEWFFGNYSIPQGWDRVNREWYNEWAHWSRAPNRNHWHRSPDGSWYRGFRHPIATGDEFRSLAFEVLRQNESVLVAVVNNDTYYDERIGISGTNTTYRFYVTKGDDPHLRAVRATSEGENLRFTTVLRVVNYRTATAPRPESAPWTTLAELFGRSMDGLAEVF